MKTAINVVLLALKTSKEIRVVKSLQLLIYLQQVFLIILEKKNYYSNNYLTNYCCI